MANDDTTSIWPKIRKDGEIDGRGRSEGSRSTQFAPGDGRKRPGRPKRSKDERTEICEIRDMPVPITFGGRTRKVSTRKAMLLKMRSKALKGDQRAAEYLDRKFAQYEPVSTDPDLTAALLAEDLAILDGWRSRSGVTHRTSIDDMDAVGESEHPTEEDQP